MDQLTPNYKTLYLWASSDLLGKTSDFTTHASIVFYRKREHPKKHYLFGKEHGKFVKVVPCWVGEPVCCDESSDSEGSFGFIYSTIFKNFSFAYPSSVLRKPISLRLMSPLPSYTQIVGRLFEHSPFYVTTLAICHQWTYSSIFSKPKV